MYVEIALLFVYRNTHRLEVSIGYQFIATVRKTEKIKKTRWKDTHGTLFLCVRAIGETKIILASQYAHVQQTPKPLAQEPEEVPPLLVHSDLGPMP
jgi:hypothetical protein